MLYFDWDPQKAQKNLEKHRVSFSAASASLEDPYAIEEFDQMVDGEVRLRTTGMAADEVIVLVSHANELINDGQDEVARIISARKASAGERREYDDQRAKNRRDATHG